MSKNLHVLKRSLQKKLDGKEPVTQEDVDNAKTVAKQTSSIDSLALYANLKKRFEYEDVGPAE